MSVREFEQWKRYYKQAPFDDLHRYHRPAAIISHSMGGSGDIGKTIDLLVNDRAVVSQLEQAMQSGRYSEADLKTFAALGVTPPKG